MSVRISYRSSGVCEYAMHTKWELCSPMSVELQIVDNSPCIVCAYNRQLKLQSNLAFYFLCFLKLLHQAETLKDKETIESHGQ